MPAPMEVVPRTPGPAPANLQGKKPRGGGQHGASEAMGISARGPFPAWVDRLFGKRSMGWRNRSTDRDRHNRRCAVQIDRQGGCPGRRAGEHGHGRSRGGEAEVQYWSLRRTDSDHDVSILITIGDVAGRWRGEEPRLNVSMMIMRPPQHGHGCESGFGSLEVVASAGLDDAIDASSNRRARAMVSARVPLASRP